MSHSEETPQVTVLPPNKEKIKQLWTVAGILGIITAIEFVIAFTSESIILVYPYTNHFYCMDVGSLCL